MAAIALGHEIAADHEKDEDPNETEDRLIAGDPGEGLVCLAALGDQEGMLKYHRKRGRKPHGVEIVDTLGGGRIRHNFE
jgi:hypothetical protein